MRNFLYVLAIVLPFQIAAQPGHYFLSHFSPDKKVDRVVFDMVQDKNGLQFLATRAGILQFDGTNWDLLEGGGAVYAMEADADGKIFWGGVDGFGVLVRAPDGRMIVEKRSGTGVADIFQVSVGGGKAYFLSDEALCIYDSEEEVHTIRAGEHSGAFTAMVEIFGVPYVSTERASLYRLQDENGLSPVVVGAGIDEILFSARYDTRYLIGTSDNRLYTCGEDLVMKEIVIAEKEYLRASVVVGGGWVTDRLVAIATLRGGVIFIDPLTGSVTEIIDYSTGLPDNEVYSLYIDNDRNVWTSHDYGITRISPFVPLRSYSNYQGLRGNILCARTHHDDVYVGTSLGLFKLVKEQVYETFTYYVNASSRKVDEEPHANEDKDGAARKTRRGGLFGFLKKNRKKAATAKRNDEPEQVKRVGKILRSERYVYQPVKGINAKVSSLIQADGKLLASGLTGIFEVRDRNAIPLMEEPVRFAFATRDNHLIVGAYDQSIQLLAHTRQGWTQNAGLDNPDDYVSQVFEDEPGKLWWCGVDRIYQATVADAKFSGFRTNPVDNPGLSKLVGFAWDSTLTFVNATGFFKFEKEAGTLERIDSLGAPEAYFASPGRLIYSDGHTWSALGYGKVGQNINALSLLEDIRAVIATGNSGDLWIIEGNDKLYRFFGDVAFSSGASYPLLPRSIKQGRRHLAMHGRVVVEQEGGPVIVNVVQPNYSGPSEYRYNLLGISDGWSAWSELNNQITFPYLPSGNYVLQVQSRDIFGTLHDMKSLSLHVQPLFWRSSWFYAMELAIFGLLGWLSLKLSVRYHLISRLLALLTIILLIEFIQTLAGYSFSTSSPVADFLLQVAVAVLILPVEGYLRKVMFRSGHKSRLLALIDDLNRREKIEK